MKSFLKKNKFNKLANSNIKTKDAIAEQSLKNTNKSVSIRMLAPSNYLFKNVNDFTSDWAEMSRETAHGVEDIELQYKKWSIEFDKFDYRLLPFIKVNVIYKSGDGSIEVSDEEWTTLESLGKMPYFSYWFELTDIEGEDFLKKVIIRCFFHVTNPDESTYINYAKLIIQFINPRSYP